MKKAIYYAAIAPLVVPLVAMYALATLLQWSASE